MNADRMMARMGFAVTDTGPYVTELRALVARQVSEGMTNRSAGTWAEDCYEWDEQGLVLGYKISAEDRAKAFLQVEWEMQNGHGFEVKALDRPVGWTTNIKTMRRSIQIHPELILPWLGDRWRELGSLSRTWRDRYVLRRRNPYA